MGWVCKQCSKDNNYRYSQCIYCHTPMDEDEIRNVVAEEIALQRRKVGEKILKISIKVNGFIDINMSRRKRINKLAAVFLIILMTLSAVTVKDLNINTLKQVSIRRIAIKTKSTAVFFTLLGSRTQLHIKEILNGKLRQSYQQFKSVKSDEVKSKFKETYKKKDFKNITLPKLQKMSAKVKDLNKLKLLEERLWEVICKISSLI